MTEKGSGRDALARVGITAALAWAGIAGVLLAGAGCGSRIDEQIAAMHEAEGQIEAEAEGFREDLRVLQPMWDVAEALEEASGYESRLHDFIRERFYIEDAYRSGKEGRVETRRKIAEFLARARSLVETIQDRRDAILTIREMSDEAAVRLSEVTEVARKAEEDIGRVADEKRRILFKSRLLALRKGISESQTLLETGMREMQVEAEPARVVYRAGINKLAEIDRSLRDLLEEIRAAGG